MSLTTFADLVVEAERALTEIVARRTLDRAGLIAGWPAFSRSAVHAITAATGSRQPRWYAVDRLAIEIARPMPAGLRSNAAAMTPDAGLARAAQLLGAAGDLLAGAPRESVADAMLDDENVRAAQARAAALLAAGAHVVARAVGEADQAGERVPEAERRLAGGALFVEELSVSVMRQSRTISSPADDVAAVALDREPLSLEEAVEVWGRHARDTVRAAHPSARDLQGLAGDLARLCVHSQVVVQAAVHEGLLDGQQGLQAQASLTEAALGWLNVTRAWSLLHTPTPATPQKVAVSHALGQTLGAVTRDGKDWATPADVAARVDIGRALVSVRRGQGVAADVASVQRDLPARMVDAGMLYAPARLLVPTLANLQRRQSNRVATAAPRDVASLMSAVTSERLPGYSMRALAPHKLMNPLRCV